MESKIKNEKSVVVPKGLITLLMTKNGPIMIITNSSTLPSEKVFNLPSLTNETKQTLGLESIKPQAGADQRIHETEITKGKTNVNNKVEPKEVVNILTASATERSKSARAKMLIDGMATGLHPIETTENLKSNYLAKDTSVQWIKKTTESKTVTSKTNILTAAESERSKSIRAKRLIDSLQQVESIENEKVKDLKRESGIHWVKKQSPRVNRLDLTRKQSENTKTKMYSITSTIKSELDNENKFYSCHKCGEKFKNIDFMMKHFATHRNEKSSTPPAKKLKASPKEGKNIGNHKQITELNCSKCNYKCNETENMEIHMKIHADEIEKPFSCDTCGERFTLNTHLMQHIKGHAVDKLFSCSTCEQKFTQKHSLLSHFLSHVGEKRFICSICKKSFQSEYNLNKHKIKHVEGEKDCHICSKTFSSLQTARIHMKKHEKTEKTKNTENTENYEDTYICGVCDMSYNSKSDLLQHLSEHTENDEPIELFEESFLCPYCEDIFLNRDDLIQHFEAAHI